MASRKGAPRWTAARYKEAVKGAPETYGLRRVAMGFDATSGFDLRKVSDWTPAQKRKVREMDKRLSAITKQPTVPKYIRDPKKLREAQAHFHNDVPSRGFKVVLVPDYGQTIEKVDKSTGEIKKIKTVPKLIFSDVMIEDEQTGETKIERVIDLEWKSYTRRFVRFNQRALAADPRTEVRRAIKVMKGARQFFAAIGGDEDEPEGMLQGVTLAGDSRTFADKIAAAVERYPNTDARITSGRHKGDKASSHYWGIWLQGAYGYIINENSGVSPRDLSNTITAKRAETKALRAQGPEWNVIEDDEVVGTVRGKTEATALKRARAEFGKRVFVEIK